MIFLRGHKEAIKRGNLNISRSRSIFLVFLFLAVFGSAASVYAAIYYVAKGGSDSNPGTEEQPWLTIQKAADTLQAGDTVYVKAGTYNETVTPANSGSAGNYITYEAYEGESVIVDGGTSITGWVLAPESEVGCANKVYKKPVAEMPWEPWWASWNNKFILHVHDSKMDDGTGLTNMCKDSTDSYWDGVEAIYGEKNDIEYMRFRNVADPDDEDVKFGRKWHYVGAAVFRLADRDYIKIKGFTIRNNTIGILIRDGSDYNIIENNIISNPKHGLWIYNGPTNNEIRYNTITLNYIHTLSPTHSLHKHIWYQFKPDLCKCDPNAVMFYNAGNNNKVYGNTIYEHFNGVGDGTSDNSSTWCQNLEVYNNTIYTLKDDALEPDGGEVNTKWHNNYVYDCNACIRIKSGGHGVGPMHVYRNKFYTTDATWSGEDIYIFAGTSMEAYIYHNSLGGDIGIKLGTNNIEEGAANLWFINNAFSNEDFFYEQTPWGEYWNPHFDYNWCGGDATLLGWMDTGNIIATGERLWDTETPEFFLSIGNSAIGGGSHMTTASNTESASTSLDVADAKFFVANEWIRIGESNLIRKVTDVDLDNDILTLDLAASWSSGDKIYHAIDFAGKPIIGDPDMGAYGYPANDFILGM